MGQQGHKDFLYISMFLVMIILVNMVAGEKATINLLALTIASVLVYNSDKIKI